jgi:hypothetical protein
MSDTIEKLTKAVRGRVITPADSGYDDALGPAKRR